MESIKKSYIINVQTHALIPTKNIKHQTIVLGKRQKKYIAQKPIEIIRESCLKYWSSYDGRREAVIENMGFKQKVPIPICLRNNILLFPTHSPYRFENIWLSPLAIKDVLPISRQPPQTKILFKDGRSIDLNVSLHIIKTQIERASACLSHIKWKNHGDSY